MRFVKSPMEITEANVIVRTYRKSNKPRLIQNISEWAAICHANAVSKFWWHHPETGRVERVPTSERIALIHGELSELIEAERIRGGRPSEKIPNFSEAEEEAADALHRLLDYAEARGLRIGAALVAKIKYNLSRPDHDPKARLKPGGKEW